MYFQVHLVPKGRIIMNVKNIYILIVIIKFSFICIFAENSIRSEIDLNDNWKTEFGNIAGAKNQSFIDDLWKSVNIPHNWINYQDLQGKSHGTLHGVCWYRKHFTVGVEHSRKRIFVEFQGVGSYADVFVNGDSIGRHEGGRTVFILDITSKVTFGSDNVIAVRADHPSGIKDLPWICGGCVGTPKCEGSQPMGIFRPVKIVITDPLRVEPFGVYVWSQTVSQSQAVLRINSEIKNYGTTSKNLILRNEIINAQGTTVAVTETPVTLGAGTLDTVKQMVTITSPHLWNGIQDPYMYKAQTKIIVDGTLKDLLETTFGIRKISWPLRSNLSYFTLNGKQLFINGTAEYEHLTGSDHAFTNEQIDAEIGMLQQAGFNAYRDAHQPHNLHFYDLLDKYGILCWPQFTSYTNFNNQKFYDNFRRCTVEWIRERRNHPSVILWGIENESDLPTAFVTEIRNLIRTVDTTTFDERLAVTCHYGTGSDWNVPQEWSGCYGGNYTVYNPSSTFGSGTLVGEYGMWTMPYVHVDKTYTGTEAIQNENYQCQLLEAKVRLGEKNKNTFCGHFQWLFSSHSNPGRSGDIQMERNPISDFSMGPINTKGLFTHWREPYDAYYMYCGNYADKNKNPVVYIVSHNWPNRWSAAGKVNNICVYSNCDQVELFNDYKASSLGMKERGVIGTHFQWDNVDLKYNVLYAEGSVGGAVVTTDAIILNNLPQAPNRKGLDIDDNAVSIKGIPNGTYIRRVNCGGAAYTDKNGQIWDSDKRFSSGSWGYISWGSDLSYSKDNTIGRTYDPIAGTNDDTLFQTFRWGREKTGYRFTVPNGIYGVELYFVEPWYGTGGKLDCAGWRIFDVAVNNKILKDIDLWREAGHDRLSKKSIEDITVSNGTIDISFPTVKANQAIISAIAIVQGGSVGLNTSNKKLILPQLSFHQKGIIVSAPPLKAVEIDIITLSGRKVQSLIVKGTTFQTWKTLKLHSGTMYLFRVHYDNSTIIKRTMLVSE
jgi:hypothetical protein